MIGVENKTKDGAIKLAQQTKPGLIVGAMTFMPDTRRFIVSMKGPDDLTNEVGMTKVYVTPFLVN